MPVKSVARTRRTTAPKKAVASTKKLDPALDAVIDFPREGELVMPGHYAVRISAKPDFDVEISTDGKEWLTTRPSVGFHWFDWLVSKQGRAVLTLRAKSGKGRWKTVSERECIVIPQSGN